MNSSPPASVELAAGRQTVAAPPLASQSFFHCVERRNTTTVSRQCEEEERGGHGARCTHRPRTALGAPPTRRLLYSEPSAGGAVGTRRCTGTGWWSSPGNPPSCSRTCGRSPPVAGRRRSLRREHAGGGYFTSSFICVCRFLLNSPKVTIR